ncbi:hypothetical protein B0H14DRAFT_3712396, partial [Mycena olivaceomarginata]
HKAETRAVLWRRAKTCHERDVGEKNDEPADARGMKWSSPCVGAIPIRKYRQRDKYNALPGLERARVHIPVPWENHIAKRVCSMLARTGTSGTRCSRPKKRGALAQTPSTEKGEADKPPRALLRPLPALQLRPPRAGLGPVRRALSALSLLSGCKLEYGDAKSERDVAYAGYQRAMALSFGASYGTDVNDLGSLQSLARVFYHYGS